VFATLGTALADKQDAANSNGEALELGDTDDLTRQAFRNQ
jgi:hypothetical protein